MGQFSHIFYEVIADNKCVPAGMLWLDTIQLL